MKRWDEIIPAAVVAFNAVATYRCRMIWKVEAQREMLSPIWQLSCYYRTVFVKNEKLMQHFVGVSVRILPFKNDFGFRNILDRFDAYGPVWHDMDCLLDDVFRMEGYCSDADSFVPHLNMMESSLRRLLTDNNIHGDHEAIVHYIVSGAYDIVTVMAGDRTVQAWIFAAKRAIRSQLPSDVPSYFSLAQHDFKEAL